MTATKWERPTASRRRRRPLHSNNKTKATHVLLVCLLLSLLVMVGLVLLQLSYLYHTTSNNNNNNNNTSWSSMMRIWRPGTTTPATTNNSNKTKSDAISRNNIRNNIIQSPSNYSSFDDLVLLTTPEYCTVTTDVRGNLGPASVLLNNGTDWLHDRWQAASDMGGTAIKGSHWVQIAFTPPVRIRAVILDWETAYSDHYQLQILSDDSNNNINGTNWKTIFTAPHPSIQITKFGTSPGFTKKPMPLHILHNFTLPKNIAVIPSSVFRIVILKSVTGWGVSLWRIQLFGSRQEEAYI